MTTSTAEVALNLVENLRQEHAAAAFTPKELYRLGCVLHQLEVVHADGAPPQHEFQSAYHQLLQGLPHRTRFFDVLLDGLDQLLLSPSAEDQVTAALHALDSLYRHSELSQASSESTTRTVEGLAKYYATFHRIDDGTATSATLLSPQSRTALFSFLVRLLWKSPSHFALDWDDTLPVLEILQEHGVWRPLTIYLDETVGEGWQQAWLDGYHVNDPDDTGNTNDDETQRDYLASWLQAAATNNADDDDALALAQAIAHAKPPRGSGAGTEQLHQRRPARSASATSADPVQRQVDQVRSIFPQYGEGFVELALSVHQWQVEDTVATLSSPTKDDWPAALRTVDTALPRRHQARVQAVDDEAREITKAALRAADEQAEQEAAILTRFEVTEHDEYDDDYDDQWDAVNDTAAANDGGLYDDYDAVRTYNRLVRDTEREAAFWQANANPNQRGKRNTGGGSSTLSTQYRGPDKLKGGRVPKPPPGGDQSQQNTKMSDRNQNNSSSNNNNNKMSSHNAEQKSAPTSGKTSTHRNGNDKSNAESGKPSRAAQRHKERKLANRRNKQRQAAASRE